MTRISPEVKRLAHKRAGGTCEKCGARYNRGNWEAHVHHLTYERAGHELLEDVIVLCLDCHNACHPHHEFVDRSTQRQRAKNSGRENRKRRKLNEKKDRARAAKRRVKRIERRIKRESRVRF